LSQTLLSSSAVDLRIVVSLAMDEPMLKAMMTLSMMKLVEFRMAASSHGALACERTTVGRGTAIRQTISTSRLGKFFIQGRKFTHPWAEIELIERNYFDDRCFGWYIRFRLVKLVF
jgi:hypothetical protein